MALALKDRVKETTIVVGTGAATLLGSSIGFQPFSVVGNGNTTYYCISDQFGSNWEVGIGTYSSSGNTLARTTVLASSNGGALVVFTAGVKDVFVTYPAEKGVWLDASNNAIGLGTPAAFVGTNITGTASGLTAGNVTTNANLSGAVSSIGNSTSLGSFTSAQLALAISDETGTGKAVFATNPTLTSPTYAGTLTGSTDILNIGSGQLYKDASGNVGIGTSSPSTYGKLAIEKASANNTVVGAALLTNRSYSTNNNGIALLASASNGTLGAHDFGAITFNEVPNSNGGGAYVNMYIGGYSSSYGNTPRFLQAYSSTGNPEYVALWTGGTERMRIDSSGNLLVGTTSTTNIAKLTSYSPGVAAIFAVTNTSLLSTPVLQLSKTDNNSTTSNTFVQFLINGFAGGSGQINANGGASAAFGSFSDARLKENITELPNQLANILALKPSEFDYKDGLGHQIGFIAQEMKEVYPDVVGEGTDGMLIITGWSKTEARLVKAIQELKAIIDTQQEQINSLLGK